MTMEFSETDGFSEPNLSNGAENLTPLFEPTLNNSEMTMGKDDFDHLLFGNTINAALKQTFNDPMSMEPSLPPECSVLKNPSDSGFFDDSTVMSTDTDFESLPTSPRSLYFSNSPFSSESGIEDDDEFEESKMESLEITQASAVFLDTQCSVPVSSSSYQNSSCPAAASLMPASLNKVLEVGMQQEQKQQLQTESIVQASSVAAAYEELKQLLYTVASQSQTSSSLASLTTIMSDSSSNNIVLPNILPACTPNQGIGVMNVPVSTALSYTSATPATTQTVQASLSPVACSSSLIMTPCHESRTHVNPKYGRKTKKGREKPKLVILDEPEENYRARYESEGCRGPIHGSSDNTYPTIKVSGYTGPVWITVYLVTSSGQPHYHSIHGPGSTKVPCKEIKLPGDIPAVQLMVDPDSNMTAVLDSLSIRRLRNWEGDKELKKRGIDPRTWKRERKEARLLFQAEIPSCDGQPDIKLSCKSRIFQCSSSGPTGSPEIWWASRTEGAVEGKQEMGLIGKKFPSAFKVKFSAEFPSVALTELALH